MNGKWTRLIIAGAALGALGCEALIPWAISEAEGPGDDDGALTSASLTVAVESASGTLDGMPLRPELFDTRGQRNFGELQFTLSAPAEGIEVFVSVDAESSGINPYTGESGGGGFPGEPPRPVPFDDGGVGDFGGAPPVSFSSVMLCSSVGLGPRESQCLDAKDFSVEVEQTADGRLARVRGVWDDGDEARFTLRYAEAR